MKKIVVFILIVILLYPISSLSELVTLKNYINIEPKIDFNFLSFADTELCALKPEYLIKNSQNNDFQFEESLVLYLKESIKDLTIQTLSTYNKNDFILGIFTNDQDIVLKIGQIIAQDTIKFTTSNIPPKTTILYILVKRL